ncbi:hypothetical protein BJY52DRAFT_1212705 [Lactarius psammicola]|nr:hypothetical protein BJY52DRAFT_1212705 [Lactarius psammicola]
MASTLTLASSRRWARSASDVLGNVDVNRKLSAGIPDLLLTLTNSHTISELSFHLCPVRIHLIYLPPVLRSDCQALPPPHRLSRFAPTKALSFVPPDGCLTVVEHRFDRSASKPGAAPAVTAADAARLQVQVPFTLRTSLAINHGGAFELSFTPRAGTLEDVAVELYLGSGATGATCGGEWIGNAHPRPARAAQIPFAQPADALLGALKIDQLKLSEMHRPYKGVRGRALGRVEWRVE